MTEIDWKIYGAIVAHYPDWFGDLDKRSHIHDLIPMLDSVSADVLRRQVESLERSAAYERQYNHHLVGREPMPLNYIDWKFGRVEHVRQVSDERFLVTREKIKEMGF